jgi:aminopeptidase-like protein
MHGWAKDLFPICRSITGNGLRQTLRYLQRLLPGLDLHEVPSGTKAFDWTVPDEWNVRDAFLIGPDGQKVIDFRRNNLHVVGYSEPVEATLTLEELQPHLHSLPDLPEAVPYITSYYRRNWGFCLAHRDRLKLKRGRYRVKIDSALGPGSLTYGDLVLEGRERKEVFFSTYVCHPSMANNELSGPVVAAALARWLMGRGDRRYTYRFVFAPETIGAIVYLSRNLDILKRNVVAGFILSCVGDERAYSIVESRLGDTLADRVARHVLRHQAGTYATYRLWELGGSDERQYGSPGADLPVVCFSRSKAATYPEYHTSLDDLGVISPRGLEDSLTALERCVAALECNRIYRNTCVGEPQLGKRGLYPALGARDNARVMRTMMTLLAYADGRHDLLAIAERAERPVEELFPLAEKLLSQGLLAAET